MNIKEFLITAKKHCYAASSGSIPSTRPSSYDLKYQDGSLIYIDSYLGTHCFTGEEAVWDGDKPLWAMNYSGRVLNEEYFKSSFLKEALMHPSFEYPYRGQPRYQRDDYRYAMHVEGDFDWFSGYEAIYYQDTLIYELVFHGGLVDDRHFD